MDLIGVLKNDKNRNLNTSIIKGKNVVERVW